MNTENKGDWSKEPQDHLYLLSWIDCVERLDLLLLEARQLQDRIIYTLREPTLYLPIAEEESHLWGQGWVEKLDDKGQTDAALASEWLMLYPKPNEAVENHAKTPDESGRTYEQSEIERALIARWHAGYWGHDQRRHYHTLCTIQILKRNILQDKITLCREALRAPLYTLQPKPLSEVGKKQWSKPKFMLLRTVILARTRGYVARLADHQHAFNKIADTGPQDSPRPTTERRRELGIYTDYIADRARDLQRDMNLLLTALKVKDAPSPLVLHSWANVSGSQQHYLRDEVGERTGSQEQSVQYITTQYWMPERPDLQPIIAHEVAHGVLRARLGNLADASLEEAEDDFSDLLLGSASSITTGQAGSMRCSWMASTRSRANSWIISITSPDPPPRTEAATGAS